MNIHSIVKSAKSFFAGTALSRLTGLIRDMAMAISFGSSIEIASFMVAYRLANLFRRMLGEGNLQSGFVPTYTSLKEDGPYFFRDVTYSLGVILIGLVTIIEGGLWFLRGNVQTDWLQIIDFAMWMVPGLIFITLYGLNSALLQCHNRYFIPAVSPVMFNLIWIGSILFFPDVYFLSFMVTIAFFGQWLMTAIQGMRLLKFSDWIRPKLFSTDFKKLLKPLFLGIIGVSAVQLNSALDAIFSKMAEAKGPAFLWYAIRLEQLPLALFGIALSSALLPPLAKEEDPTKRKELLDRALRLSGIMMTIFTFGIFALGSAGVDLIYGHGGFSPFDVKKTTECLWGYGLGLVPSVFVLILASSFYAEKDYRRPMRASLYSVALNIFLNALFVLGFQWGSFSIALATSISSFVNVVFLRRDLFSGSMNRFMSQMIILSTISLLMVFFAEAFILPSFEGIVGKVFRFAFLSMIYLASVTILLRLFQRDSLKSLLIPIHKK